MSAQQALDVARDVSRATVDPQEPIDRKPGQTGTVTCGRMINETRKLKLFPRLWHLHARLFLSFGFGAIVALGLLALPWRVSTRVIFGWDAGVALYIALIFLVMGQGSIAKIRRRASINDEGAIALLVLTVAASLASLAFT
jgi:uncharacterized membrane protein